jgi:hypothetical protein
MATLTLAPTAENAAHRRADLPLLPVAGDAAAQITLTASRRFGPFAPGDQIVIGSTAAFHCLAGSDSVAATTAHPVIPAGLYHMTVPDGVTHVAMIDTAAGAGNGQAYLG